MGVLAYDANVAAGGRGPSPCMYGPFGPEIKSNPSAGIHVFHDFKSVGGTVASNVGTYASDGGGFKTYESTSSTFYGANSINSVVYPGGIMEASCDATANHVVSVEFGDLHALAPFVPTVNSGPPVGFAIKVLFQQIVTQDWFAGFTIPNKATATGVFTGDALQGISLIGFWILTGASSTVKCGYGLSTASLTTVGTLFTPLVANTWYEFGWVLTPGLASNLLQFFVNGVEVVAMRKTDVGADANFPTGLGMVPNVTGKTVAAGTPANTFDYDWVLALQGAP